MTLTLKNISREYGETPALRNVDLTVRDGEFLALLGPSGSGKTTLLRILAGLDKPTSGTADLSGQDFLSLDARSRRVGMVFQSYALFRHMTVANNIAFGLKVRPRSLRPSKPEIAARVDELLRLMQLEDFGTRYPSQLSGGQRQRVALARALAIEPRLLLLDEPFGALDARVRRDLRRWLRELHERTGITTILVTHDQDEALELADRVAILHRGRIEQIDTPQNLYDKPASAFVHDFLGEGIRLPAHVTAGQVIAQQWRGLAPDGVADGEAVLCIRPEDLTPAETGLTARLLNSFWRGHKLILEVEVEQQKLQLVREADEPHSFRLAQSASGTRLHLSPRRYHVLPSQALPSQQGLAA